MLMITCELHDQAQANLLEDERDVANKTSLPHQITGKISEGEPSSWPANEPRHMKSLPNLETQLHLVHLPAAQKHDIIKWLLSSGVDGKQQGFYYFGIVLSVLTSSVSKDTTLMKNLSQHCSGIHISQFLNLSFDTMSDFFFLILPFTVFADSKHKFISANSVSLPPCHFFSTNTSLLIAKIHLL